ncbi:MAG: hypothetical protein ACI857_002438 [Arenicella sp.]|jgi:hypothetical protein
MSKKTAINNSKFFDFIEDKDFSELSINDQLWIKENFSEEEYFQQRAIIANLPAALEKDEKIIPLPLVLPAKSLGRVIPLYQALTAIAAVAALIIFYFSIFGAQTELINKTEYIVQHDTVEVEKIIRDTVFQEVEKKIYVSNEVVIPTENTSCFIQETRLLESNPGIYLPDLNLVEIENTGSSLKDDATAVLISDYLNF